MSITVFFEKNANDKSGDRHKVVCGECQNESSYFPPDELVDPKKFRQFSYDRKSGGADFKVYYQCLKCRHEDHDVCFISESVKDM